MPEPIKPALWGTQSLIRFPDARVMVVQGKENYEAAQRVFPQNPVVGFDGAPADTALHYVRGRDIIVWLDNPLPQLVRRATEDFRGLECKAIAFFAPDSAMECWPAREIEKRRFGKHWLLQRLKPVEFAANAPAPALNGQGSAMPPAEAQTRPAASEEEIGADVATKPRKPKKRAIQRTEGTPWQDFGLILSEKGLPLANLQNCVSVIEHHDELAGHVWYDVFLQRMLHTWGIDAPAEWSDYDDVRLALFIQRAIGINNVNKFTAHDAIVAYGMREKRNCAYDWMDALQWDHQPRLWKLGPQGFGTSGSEYECAVCRNLILAMVKRVYEPGCKSDYMPIFEGAQGAGKSKALSILGGAWFAECHESIMSKDFFGVLQGKMLIEISEMHAFRQSEVERVKGIVSCPTDRFREPYGRNATDHPRQGAFAGTTNRDDWNRDDTGARRFWPVKCGVIDHAWLITNREQLFAEAVYCVRDMDESHWIVPWETAKSEQDERQFTDTWEEVVRDWLVGKSSAALGDVLAEAVKIEHGKQGLAEQQRMGRVMKKLGWSKKVRFVGGVQKKVWLSADALENPPELFSD